MKRSDATRLLAAAVAAFALTNAIGQTTPDKWPTKPVRVLVPFPAGGPTDITARTVGQALSIALGVPFIVENKAGGRGFVGTSEAARAPADGYTLLMSSVGAMAINPRLYDKLPYDSQRDFAPVSLVVTVPIAVVINPEVLPVKDIGEFVQFLKANPGKVNYGSAGSGGSSHLVPEYFKFRTGTFMTHIPYQGTGPAVAALVAGHVHVTFDTLLTNTPFVKSGKLRMLAVTTGQRLAQYPDVPTIAEALALPDFDASSWFALYAPAGTPPEVVKRLSAEVAIALKQPDVARRLTDLGAVPVGSSAQELGAFQRAEQEKWGKVIQRAHIKPD
jgi:tripartite-type tricarboxylate transporter receptor subunit TctC